MAATPTFNETCVTILKAAIEGRLTSDIEDFQFRDRAVKHIPIKELFELLQYFEARVAEDDAAARLAAGLKSNRKISVRFI